MRVKTYKKLLISVSFRQIMIRVRRSLSNPWFLLYITQRWYVKGWYNANIAINSLKHWICRYNIYIYIYCNHLFKQISDNANIAWHCLKHCICRYITIYINTFQNVNQLSRTWVSKNVAIFIFFDFDKFDHKSLVSD